MTYKPSPISTRILYFLAVIVGVAAVFALWLDGGAYTETWPRPFDPVGWQAASEHWRPGNTYEKIRCGMVLDLQYRIGLTGKTRAEVVHLLGQPDGEYKELPSSYWALCPSFMDVWILEVRWRGDHAISAIVRDT